MASRLIRDSLTKKLLFTRTSSAISSLSSRSFHIQQCKPFLANKIVTDGIIFRRLKVLDMGIREFGSSVHTQVFQFLLTFSVI